MQVDLKKQKVTTKKEPREYIETHVHIYIYI